MQIATRAHEINLEDKHIGYTHYFRQNKSVTPGQWAKIIRDARILLENSPVEFGDGRGGEIDSFDSLITEHEIVFNGLGEDDSHETFYLPRNETKFNFCKTDRKPYDILVCAALIIADAHAPGCYEIDSDGDFEEWIPALRFVSEHCEDETADYAIPSAIRAEERV